MSLGSFKKQVKYILLIAVSLVIFEATVILGKQASVYFASSSLTKQGDSEEEDVTPTQRTMPSVTVPAASAQPTSSLSLFCKAVQANIGKNETVESEWSSLKTYDIDSNGIINGLDVIKCQK